MNLTKINEWADNETNLKIIEVVHDFNDELNRWISQGQIVDKDVVIGNTNFLLTPSILHAHRFFLEPEYRQQGVLKRYHKHLISLSSELNYEKITAKVIEPEVKSALLALGWIEEKITNDVAEMFLPIE